MFGLLVDTFGGIELENVHRFTNDWERDASLRLRRGDVTAADDYDEHGRLHGGSAGQMERRAVHLTAETGCESALSHPRRAVWRVAPLLERFQKVQPFLFGFTLGLISVTTAIAAPLGDLNVRRFFTPAVIRTACVFGLYSPSMRLPS